MPRTTHSAVKAVLGNDYDNVACPDLAPRIRAANLLTTRVNTCATSNGYSLSTDELREIETWLAAYFYTLSDPIYQSKNTSSAGGTFVRNPKTPNSYLEGAIALDISGCLNAIINRLSAGVDWLGLAPSDQTDYEDRD